MTDALDLNRQLATLLGWTNITETGNALLGTPPEGEPQCRGQARVPDWIGDWRDCGPLIAKFRMQINATPEVAYAKCEPEFGRGCFQMLGRRVTVQFRESLDSALREAIVHAAIAKLEAVE